MNRGRKIKHSLSFKDEENNSHKDESMATKHKLLTPCRRVGLNRKRKNIILGLSGSSSELNISSPNNSLTEIDISVNEHDSTLDTNKINIKTPVLKKNTKPRKSSLGARKRSNHTTSTNNDVILSTEEITKKYKHIYNIISDVSVVLTRCDFDKHILNRNNVREPSVDISMRIENEAISSTPIEANNSEIQTNQISTTIEDATPTEIKINEGVVTEKTAEEVKALNKSVTSKKIKDLFGDNSDDSDFESSLKQKKRKRFSLKTTSTKPNKKDTTSTEDTNDDSTQNTFDGIDIEIQKYKTEKNKPDKNVDKKNKKTIEPYKNNEDANESLEERDANIPKTKTKPAKEDKQKNKMQKRDTDSQIDSDEIPELNVSIPRKKRKRSSSHSKKSPKVNKKESATKPRPYISDSDDDFVEKPRREKKDPDIKKKINIPTPDPLNRIEHIRIRENKSYTIMHMNNISSYVKYYDNDVNLKRTESDDNQQTTSQPVVSNVKTSMILERKDYLNKGSQESNPEPINVVNDDIENPESTNIISDCIENPESTNIISDHIENPESTNISDRIENPEPINITDRIENPETTNVRVVSDVAEFSNNLECNAVNDIENLTTNTVIDGFAGFTAESTNINIFSVDPDSNDIEYSNSYFNYIENSNDTIDKPEAVRYIENPKTVSDVEKLKAVSDIEIPEGVNNTENQGDPQNEMNNILKLKSNLINQIKIKRDKLASLKRIMTYKKKLTLDDLTKTTLQFKYILQEALVDLLSHLKTHTERNFNMLLLLGFLKIPSEMVGYNDETQSFE